jgi:NAD(P)-dependent dehydrogenase (short-subunit alcohol dehydrogenase family)
VPTGIAGRTAVLSGAGKTTGLGHAFAKGLASAGADVVIADVVDGGETAAAVRKLGRRATFVECDVSSPNDVERLAARVDGEFGGCDILVHCASPFRYGDVDELSFDDWRTVLAVNLDGMYLLTRAFLPGMKRHRWGRIIPISSASYHAGVGGRANYLAAKAGLIGFARSVAHEVGDFGITVNAIAPGLVRTERGVEAPLTQAAFVGRDKYDVLREQQSISETLEPEHLVGPLVFLASDDSALVTGQTLLVDAGWQHV